MAYLLRRTSVCPSEKTDAQAPHKRTFQTVPNPHPYEFCTVCEIRKSVVCKKVPATKVAGTFYYIFILCFGSSDCTANGKSELPARYEPLIK